MACLPFHKKLLSNFNYERVEYIIFRVAEG